MFGVVNMRAVLFILMFCIAPLLEARLGAVAPETNEPTSAMDLLGKARLVQNSMPQTSFELANEALRLSQENNNISVSAHANYLLGKLASDRKNHTTALRFFLDASLAFEELADTKYALLSAIGYASALIKTKQFSLADEIIDDTVLQAFETSDSSIIGAALKAKGDSHYGQKQYNKATVQYIMSVEYLTDSDMAVQKLLGRTLVKAAQSFKRLENREKAAEFYTKALKVYTQIDDQGSMARTLNTLAEAERYLGHYVLALKYANRSLEMHKNIDDPEGRAKALMGAGIIYRHIGRYEQSLKYVHQALRYYQKIADPAGISKTSNQLAHIYFRLKQFEQARSFYMASINLAKGEVDPKTLSTALREVAIIDLQNENYASAYAFATQADAIYEALNDKQKRSITQRILGNTKLAKNDTAKAIEFYRRSIALAQEAKSEFYQMKALIPLGRALTDVNIDEAISVLKRALSLAEKLNNKMHQQLALQYLRIAEKKRGNVDSSLGYAEQEISLQEAMKTEVNNNELALEKAKLHSVRLELELDTLKEKGRLDSLELARKNHEIRIAQQASVITELELTKNRYASLILGLSLAICVAIAFLIHRRFVVIKKLNEELDYLAARDPLTDCFNRRILFDIMERDMSVKSLPSDYSILMIDIDHFKLINDKYGHTQGDTVLRAVASKLKSHFDGNKAVVARFGGEEFCVVLPNTSCEQALERAETLRIDIQASLFESVSVTCSFGVSCLIFNAQTPSELIDQADLALFKSKHSGRNKVTLWDPSFARTK
jgi:diguanylate cyclase (GGDEF)-like protein